MMEWLLELDQKVFLALNGLHAFWLDPVMLVISKTQVWLPLYLYLLYLIVRDFKKESLLVLMGITLAIILSDQVTSGLMKPFFARLRPSHEPSLADAIHLVDGYKGGLYGFASSHASNTFATATFLWLLFRLRRPWIGLLFLWAAVVTYSRIYLGVHYPGDIVVGGIIGILSGVAGFRFFQWVKKRDEKRRASSPGAQ